MRDEDGWSGGREADEKDLKKQEPVLWPQG